MDAACTIQDSIHVFSLVHKYVSRILGTYQASFAHSRFLFWGIESPLLNIEYWFDFIKS